ncbi:MAG: helix-turn-helix transcriptional regulator [Patescibacteria group bacterium]
MSKEVLKNRVYDLRTAAEATQEELGDAVGVTRQTIIAIERGNYTPSVTLALKLARFFKKSVEDIFKL